MNAALTPVQRRKQMNQDERYLLTLYKDFLEEQKQRLYPTDPVELLKTINLHLKVVEVLEREKEDG